MSIKSVLRAAPVDTTVQRLPLEGKLAAKPTDEVANKDWEKAEASIKDAGFPPHPPSVRTGHLPLQTGEAAEKNHLICMRIGKDAHRCHTGKLWKKLWETKSGTESHKNEIRKRAVSRR